MNWIWSGEGGGLPVHWMIRSIVLFPSELARPYHPYRQFNSQSHWCRLWIHTTIPLDTTLERVPVIRTAYCSVLVLALHHLWGIHDEDHQYVLRRQSCWWIDLNWRRNCLFKGWYKFGSRLAEC